MTASFALIGIAVVAAGVVGVLMPEGERLAAVLPLVAGAGVGILTLALGASDLQDPADGEAVFLQGSVLGFVTAIGMLAVLWRRTAHERRSRADGGPR
jgi:hypothetical protein